VFDGQDRANSEGADVDELDDDDDRDANSTTSANITKSNCTWIVRFAPFSAWGQHGVLTPPADKRAGLSQARTHTLIPSYHSNRVRTQ
jgi:hypothetical protein